jgi:hypothetical protein
VYSPGQNISFDESTCPWKGRLRFRVYNPAKPDKFGIKLYAATEAKSGYVLGFEIYQGAVRPTDFSEPLNIEEDLTVTTRTVLSLLTYCNLLDKGHHVYMDNYYTSPELFQQMHHLNTYACGTARVARQGMPEALKKRKQRQDRINLTQGQTIFRQREGMLALRHHDKRDVFMLSTIHAATEVKLNKTDEEGQPIWKPECIVDYIQNMGGVDTADQIQKNYCLLRKTVKWWRNMFFYLFTTSLCNAYILHKKFSGRAMSHYEFRKELIHQLMMTGRDAPQPAKRGRRSANPLPRLTGVHTAAKNVGAPGAKRKVPLRDCCACNAPKGRREGMKRKQSSYHCVQCNVTLCHPHCFNAYHSVEDYRRQLQQRAQGADNVQAGGDN